MLRQLFVILLSLVVTSISEVTIQMHENDKESAAVRAQKLEIIEATKNLLKAITISDYEAYRKMCHPSLTSFEPESLGVFMEGMEFHRFLMESVAPTVVPHTIIVNPHVHMLGDDAAYIAYVRLTQNLGQDLKARIAKAEETRIWHRNNGTWQHIHFHRSGSTSMHLSNNK
ncbi:calcium/calmodulin-dependent protein kinase type II subunit delta-like [Stigmatopora nigra]